MLVEITNDFHNTAARVRVGRMTLGNARRVWHKLCGMEDCQCSSVESLGMRGHQQTPDGRWICVNDYHARDDHDPHIEVSLERMV